MENFVNTTVYLPLLRQFCDSALPLYRCGYPYGPFIPHVFPRYGAAPLKIFYVGRDTYYWVPNSHPNGFLRCVEERRLGDYLRESANTVTPERTLEWANNAGSFWTLAAKLQIYLLTGELPGDVRQLTTEQKYCISQLGYGNMNAIEVRESLVNEGTWDDITDVETYRRWKALAHTSERLNPQLAAYHPDVIFIFNWEERPDFFDGLDVTWHKPYYEEPFRAVYTVKGYDTKIIWSCHPRRFSFLKTNVEEMVHYLAETYQQLR